MYRIEIFQDSRGHEPFTKWIQSLSRNQASKVFTRIDHIKHGNLGDYKYIAHGVYEFRIFSEGGIRIYFGRKNNTIIILLCGGLKDSQKRDIKKAIEYWREYNERG